MAAPVLKAQHLGIQFGGLKAVDDFNMEIGESELVGLIGPNGAGKTTVFNLITGVYKPTEGSFYLCGERMDGKKTLPDRPRGHRPHLPEHSPVQKDDGHRECQDRHAGAHHLRSGGCHLPHQRNTGSRRRRSPRRAKELLKVVHLSGKEDLEADNLPYGEQRRLEIARALATDMKLLLLDEPAAGMNPTETEELLEIINYIRNEFKVSVLLIEHDMSLVMKICERIQVLDFGTTIASGTPEQIANDPACHRGVSGQGRAGGGRQCLRSKTCMSTTVPSTH